MPDAVFMQINNLILCLKSTEKILGIEFGNTAMLNQMSGKR